MRTKGLLWRFVALSAVLLTGCNAHSVRANDYCRGRFALARTAADSAKAGEAYYGAINPLYCAEWLGRELRGRKAVTP